MKKCNYIIVLLLTALSVLSDLKAQITIGNDGAPAQGAILQLRQNENLGENSTKGLMLPRVELSNVNNLFPMFAASGNPNLPNTDYANSAYKATQDKLHTGLVVFNTNRCAPFGRGVFLWNGANWYPVSKTIVDGYSTITSLPDTLHIPSGADKRFWAPATMSFEYGSSSIPIWNGLTTGNLVFTNQTAQVLPNPPLWLASPAIFSIQPNQIGFTPLQLKMNPWSTRQSFVNISIGADACGPGTSKRVILNQTNYAISGRYPLSNVPSSNEADIRNFITIRDNESSGTVKVLSNVRWQAIADETGGTIAEVLNSYTQTPQGTNLSNGSYGTNTFAYAGAPGTPTSQFKYVKFNLRDLNNRAEDFVVTIMQCRGSEDLSSVTTTATPAQTSNPASNWGTAVVHHRAKTGYYNEFYSADFGPAGRWMTTNLAATNYDYPTSFTLNYGVQGSFSTSNTNIGYYAYPNNSLSAYNNNRFMGYLYSFPGATGGVKSGVDAHQSNNPSLPNVQGICPAGWHVPSDFEWTQLEDEIISNTTKYAYVSKSILSEGGSLVGPTPEGGDYRGTHAPTMTNACEEYTANIKGTSKKLAEGGFGAYFAGEILEGVPVEYKVSAIYWSSSTAGYNKGVQQAYYRVFSVGDHINKIGVAAFSTAVIQYVSVRCKRD